MQSVKMCDWECRGFDFMFSFPDTLVAVFETRGELGLVHEGQVRGRPALRYLEGKFIRIVGTNFAATLKRIRAFSSDKLKKYDFLSNFSRDNSSKFNFLYPFI